jgi:hypothetical protein
MKRFWLCALALVFAFGALPLSAQDASYAASGPAKRFNARRPGPPGYRPSFRPGNRPGQPGFRPGYGPPGRPHPAAQERRRPRRAGRYGYYSYAVYYYGGGYYPSYYGPSYYAGGRMHHAQNWRYVNVRQYDDLLAGSFTPSADYQRKLFYDRAESRDFPKALDDLAKGVYGALVAWPENAGIVDHSYALERLFLHLDMKLQARLAYFETASYAQRMAYGQSLVRELLAKLVDGITIEGDQYLVRFKLNNGKRSPWVAMPVVFANRRLTGGKPAYRRGASYHAGPYEVFEATASLSD